MTTVSTTPPATLTEFQQIEADISAVVTKIINGAELLAEEAVTALENLAALSPQASTWIEGAASFIESIPGVGQEPAVLATVAAVDLATKGLDTFAATMAQAQAAGGSVTVTQATQAIVAGVQAYNTAKALSGTAVTSILPVAPASAAVIASTPPAAL
jgi:hypothetical protein